MFYSFTEPTESIVFRLKTAFLLVLLVPESRGGAVRSLNPETEGPTGGATFLRVQDTK